MTPRLQRELVRLDGASELKLVLTLDLHAAEALSEARLLRAAQIAKRGTLLTTIRRLVLDSVIACETAEDRYTVLDPDLWRRHRLDEPAAPEEPLPFSRGADLNAELAASRRDDLHETPNPRPEIPDPRPQTPDPKPNPTVSAELSGAADRWDLKEHARLWRLDLADGGQRAEAYSASRAQPPPAAAADRPPPPEPPQLASSCTASLASCTKSLASCTASPPAGGNTPDARSQTSDPRTDLPTRAWTRLQAIDNQNLLPAREEQWRQWVASSPGKMLAEIERLEKRGWRDRNGRDIQSRLSWLARIAHQDQW